MWSICTPIFRFDLDIISNSDRPIDTDRQPKVESIDVNISRHHSIRQPTVLRVKWLVRHVLSVSEHCDVFQSCNIFSHWNLYLETERFRTAAINDLRRNLERFLVDFLELIIINIALEVSICDPIHSRCSCLKRKYQRRDLSFRISYIRP